LARFACSEVSSVATFSGASQTAMAPRSRQANAATASVTASKPHSAIKVRDVIEEARPRTILLLDVQAHFNVQARGPELVEKSQLPLMRVAN
jgi:hypothetical protein